MWLIDGLLQVQPRMFTGNMINGLMKPILEGQPAFLESIFHFIVNTITQNLSAVNWLIAVMQLLLGLGFIFLSDRWVKQLVVASFIWALIVWFGGEGMSMLFTGTASALTGAPGAVLLYPLIGLAVWPRTPGQRPFLTGPEPVTEDEGLLSRRGLRYALAGFWFFSAFLQLQPYWWEAGHISAAIGAMTDGGGLNGALVDPVVTSLASALVTSEVPVNFVLVLVFVAVGSGLAWSGPRYLRLFLIASIAVSALIWYVAQAFGMIFTGMATDFNSGLLLIVMALSVWTRQATAEIDRGHNLSAAGEVGQPDQRDKSGTIGSWR
jgi:hypothetical protein